MKAGILLLVVPFILILSLNSFAETSIKAQVDKTRITTDETLTYKLIIISSDKSITVTEIPGFEGFEVLSQAQSSTVSFVKSKEETQMVYVFILVPRGPGKLRIAPATIKTGADAYTSEQFEIEVLAGKKPSEPEKKIPESKEPQVTL